MLLSAHDAELARLRPDYRRFARWALIALAGLGVIVMIARLVPSGVGAWWRGETDLRGHRVYAPPFGVRTEALAEVDLESVHRDLFPGWVLTANEARDGANGGQTREKLAALRAEAGKDPNLAALIDELSSVAALSRSSGRGERFSYLVWAWSEYLDRAGASWRLEPTVRTIAGRQLLYVKSYRVVATVRASIGDTVCRARLVKREDRLNVVEPYLGHTTSRAEGALVVVDRTRDFAETQVWPMLADDAEGLSPLDAAFASSVRAEAARSLGEDAMSVLRDTARDRGAILRTADAIKARAQCGSWFRVWKVPVGGLSAETLASVARAAASPDAACPEVTREEADTLVESSRRLAATPRLDASLSALNAWVARAVTAHELRHVKDAGLDGDGFSRPCPGCSARLGRTARAEVSAYLAAFATPGVSHVSLYQACAGSADGASGSAVSAVVSSLMPGGCAGGPPDDLAGVARALETRLFGASEPVSLPVEFPAVAALGP